jgi:hypothetical protein
MKAAFLFVTKYQVASARPMLIAYRMVKITTLAELDPLSLSKLTATHHELIRSVSK